METSQVEEMINTMEVENFELDNNLTVNCTAMNKPIHELLDVCLNFISVADFEI